MSGQAWVVGTSGRLNRSTQLSQHPQPCRHRLYLTVGNTPTAIGSLPVTSTVAKLVPTLRVGTRAPTLRVMVEISEESR